MRVGVRAANPLDRHRPALQEQRYARPPRVPRVDEPPRATRSGVECCDTDRGYSCSTMCWYGPNAFVMSGSHPRRKWVEARSPS